MAKKGIFLMTIALIGPSGAGKGTQAVKLVARYDLLHISTGDLFRESLEKRTALGLLARRYMNQGNLVPDEVVGKALIEEWLWKVMPGKRILFDGFPHTRHQAEMLDTLFQQTDRYLETVIYLKVSRSGDYPSFTRPGDLPYLPDPLFIWSSNHRPSPGGVIYAGANFTSEKMINRILSKPGSGHPIGPWRPW